MKVKLIAVTDEQGHVVSTHEAVDAFPDGTPAAKVVALPGQSVHQVTTDRPQRFGKPEDVAKFHLNVSDALKKGKRA